MIMLCDRWKPWAGELLGIFILVFFGCGSVAAAVTTGAQVGVFQVAIVWGLGVATAIGMTGHLSGAHLNPAVTIAFAVWRDFPWRKVPGYILSQMAGAFLAAAVLFVCFGPAISRFEEKSGIVRGQTGSEASAMVFGEYFPNPGGKPLADDPWLPASTAIACEVIATAILVLVIFSVTDPKNTSQPRSTVPLTIGLTVTLLISLFGPLTMACFNPARDLAPRLFSSMVGWGNVPFTANGSGWLTVYILAPIVGAILGGGLSRLFSPTHAS